MMSMSYNVLVVGKPNTGKSAFIHGLPLPKDTERLNPATVNIDTTTCGPMRLRVYEHDDRNEYPIYYMHAIIIFVAPTASVNEAIWESTRYKARDYDIRVICRNTSIGVPDWEPIQYAGIKIFNGFATDHLSNGRRDVYRYILALVTHSIVNIAADCLCLPTLPAASTGTKATKATKDTKVNDNAVAFTFTIGGLAATVTSAPKTLSIDYVDDRCSKVTMRF